MDYTERTELYAAREPWRGHHVAIYLTHIKNRDGVRTISTGVNVVMEEIKEPLVVEREPLLKLNPGDAQQFIDELWRVGLRPTDGTGNAGQLGATERHLADMRKLVFDASPPAPGGSPTQGS